MVRKFIENNAQIKSTKWKTNFLVEYCFDYKKNEIVHPLDITFFDFSLFSMINYHYNPHPKSVDLGLKQGTSELRDINNANNKLEQT